jgi:hypothetical protein
VHVAASRQLVDNARCHQCHLCMIALAPHSSERTLTYRLFHAVLAVHAVLLLRLAKFVDGAFRKAGRQKQRNGTYAIDIIFWPSADGRYFPPNCSRFLHVWSFLAPFDARVHHATPRRSEGGTGTPGELSVLRGIGSYYTGATGTSSEPKSFTRPRAARLPRDRQEGARLSLCR